MSMGAGGRGEGVATDFFMQGLPAMCGLGVYDEHRDTLIRQRFYPWTQPQAALLRAGKWQD